MALVIIATVASIVVLTISHKCTVAINRLNSADTLINSNSKLALEIILLILFIMLFFAAILFYQYKKNKEQKLKLESVIRENAHLLNAFEYRMTQLMELMEIAYISDNNPSQFYKKFKSYMEITKNGTNNFSDIRYLVNRKYNGIVDYVIAEHPILSAQEIDLFSMLCFGFSSNVIRLIYGHTNLTSIFTKRKRLRIKLGLNENMKIESYISNLKEELENRVSA